MPELNSNEENGLGNKRDPAVRSLAVTPGLPIFLALLIAAITFAVYTQTFDFDIISYDDPIYTTDNAEVQNGLTLSGVIWAFTGATYDTNYWAPLTWITFLIDNEIFGNDPGGNHLTNVVFHVLNTLLLFMAGMYLTGRTWPSFFLAAFFALHPLHVESVAWISERKDVVSTFFWMLTLIAYAHYVRRPGGGRYLVVLGMFICCLMGKPMGVTLPFVLLLIDYWPLGRFRLGQPQWMQIGRVGAWPLIREKLPLFLIVAIIIPLTFYTQDRAGALTPLADVSLFIRIQNVAVAYASQVLKTFWPVHLGILYPYPANLPLWHSVAAGLLLLAVTGLALKFCRRFPYLIVGWLWFLGTFVPVAGFIIIGPHATADRYTYIPLIGLFIMLIWGGFDLLKSVRGGRQVAFCLAVGIVAAMTWQTHKQVGYWENSVKIYERTLQVTKDNWPAHLNLGAAYRERKNEALALEHYRRALSIKPGVPELYLSVGDVLVTMARIGEAVALFERALEVVPGSAALHAALAVVLDLSGETARAADHFQKALTIDNKFTEAHHGLGVNLFQQGHIDLAIAHYRQAVRYDPQFARAYYNLGIALMAKGQLGKAQDRFRDAIGADPNEADFYYGLGFFYLKRGDKHAAVEQFRQALQLSPGHPEAQKGLQVLNGKNPIN